MREGSPTLRTLLIIISEGGVYHNTQCFSVHLNRTGRFLNSYSDAGSALITSACKFT